MAAVLLIRCLQMHTYFPPLTGDTRETKPPHLLTGMPLKPQEAFDYAATKTNLWAHCFATRQNCKGAVPEWLDKRHKYYIASAGKSVTALVAGIVQQEGTININNKVSQYLGHGLDQPSTY